MRALLFPVILTSLLLTTYSYAGKKPKPAPAKEHKTADDSTKILLKQILELQKEMKSQITSNQQVGITTHIITLKSTENISVYTDANCKTHYNDGKKKSHNATINVSSVMIKCIAGTLVSIQVTTTNGDVYDVQPADIISCSSNAISDPHALYFKNWQGPALYIRLSEILVCTDLRINLVPDNDIFQLTPDNAVHKLEIN